MNPVRTCVGCRQRASRSDLLRIVHARQTLLVDSRKNLSGRGAWLHPTRQCLELATSRRAFAKALKCDQKLDTNGLSAHIEQAETMLAKNE